MKDLCQYISTNIFPRRGEVLSSKPGLYEMGMPDDDQHTLKLLKVKASDVGEILFMASNKYGNDSCTFSVEMAGTAGPNTCPSVSSFGLCPV